MTYEQEVASLHKALIVTAEKWSASVDTHWSPPEGFFSQSAEKIAEGLKRASKDHKQAASRLSFYRNRAGKNLSAEDQNRLAAAADKLSKLYEKE